MKYISEKQLKEDIKNLPKDYNKGRSAAMIAIARANQLANNTKIRQQKINKARAKERKKNCSSTRDIFKKVQDTEIMRGKNQALKSTNAALKKYKDAV